MKASLRLEAIGDDLDQYLKLSRKKLREYGLGQFAKGFQNPRPRPWVARLTGLDERYGFCREFIQGQKDYSQANSIGSRGVYLYFALEPGFYEAQEVVSWKATRRYFLQSQNGILAEVSREIVQDHLRSAGSASMS